jgi:hypothetical protein
MPKVFVSYSHKDLQFVNRLCSDLRAEHEVVVDRAAIVPDIPLIEQIAAYIDTRDFFIPVISHSSVRSPWVRREISLALQRSIQRGVSVVPIIIGDVDPTSLIAHIPYVRFPVTGSKRYMNALARFLGLIRRASIVSNNMVLRNFTSWGNITVSPVGDFGLVLHSDGDTLGASGLVYDRPMHITGFSKIVLHIDHSKQSDFTGFKPHTSKMLKLEIDDRPISPSSAVALNDDDPTYIHAKDGDVEYEIPANVRERGYLEKLQIVFGRGRINDLHIAC